MLSRLVLGLLFASALVLAIACGGAGDTGGRQRTALARGELATIAVEGESTVWVTIDQASQSELTAFSRAKNVSAIEQMMRTGRLLVCAKGTKVTVLEPGFMTMRVRMMDGKHAGQSGYLPSEWVHKQASR